MTNPIVIVGAGSHGRGVADVLGGIEPLHVVAGFLDDTKPVGEIILDHPVLGGFAAMRDRAFVANHGWIVAIGDNLIRSNLCRALADAGATFVNVIHPSAQISRSATLGRGLYVGACAAMATGAIVGDWALIGAHTFIGVDARIGEAAFIGHAAIISAGTSVGARSFLGSGTILSIDASVGADCVVGASSLVTSDLPDGTTAYGVPARPAPLKRQPLRR
jgi:sugar O-acyltransferase (sialic acid O-acetyltransferase NeuD family)